MVNNVVEVWIPTLPYPIKTKNVVRTVNKLKEKGYREDEIMIVEVGGSYWVYEFNNRDGKWWCTQTALHPMTAQKHGMCNAYGKAFRVGSIEDVQKTINE